MLAKGAVAKLHVVLYTACRRRAPWNANCRADFHICHLGSLTLPMAVDGDGYFRIDPHKSVFSVADLFRVLTYQAIVS